MDFFTIIEKILGLLSVVFIFAIARIIYIVAFRPKGIPASEFKKVVQKIAKPELSKLGFHGNGWDFTKKEGELIYAFKFVPNSQGGWIHIDLYINTNIKQDYKGHTMEVVFKKMLTPKNKIQHAWHYHKTEKQNIAILNSMLVLFQEEGFAFFKKFEQYPECFLQMNNTDVDDYKKLNDTFSLNFSKAKWIEVLILINEKYANYKNALSLISAGKVLSEEETENWQNDFLYSKEEELMTFVNNEKNK